MAVIRRTDNERRRCLAFEINVHDLFSPRKPLLFFLVSSLLFAPIFVGGRDPEALRNHLLRAGGGLPLSTMDYGG